MSHTTWGFHGRGANNSCDKLILATQLRAYPEVPNTDVRSVCQRLHVYAYC